MHGCTPLDGVYHTITRMEGSSIFEVDGVPVVGLIDEMYGDDAWQQQRPVISLLTIGVNHGNRYTDYNEDAYVNRLITGVLPGGGALASSSLTSRLAKRSSSCCATTHR